MTFNQVSSPITFYYKTILRSDTTSQALRDTWEKDILIDGLSLGAHLTRLKHDITTMYPTASYKLATEQKNTSVVGNVLVEEEGEHPQEGYTPDRSGVADSDDWHMIDIVIE
jgi:hypothetical protein